MQQYQFEKIYSQMEKEFGKIDKGEEEFHTMMFFTIESNLLKIHRQYPTSNSRRLKEAIALALFDIRTNRLSWMHSATRRMKGWSRRS